MGAPSQEGRALPGGRSRAHSRLPLQTVADVRLWGGCPARGGAQCSHDAVDPCLPHLSCHLLCPPLLPFFAISGLDAYEFLKVINAISSPSVFAHCSQGQTVTTLKSTANYSSMKGAARLHQPEARPGGNQKTQRCQATRHLAQWHESRSKVYCIHMSLRTLTMPRRELPGKPRGVHRGAAARQGASRLPWDPVILLLAMYPKERNEYKKTCVERWESAGSSTSPTSGKCKSTTAVHHLTLTGRNRGWPCTAGGNVKWCGHVGKQSSSFLES